MSDLIELEYALDYLGLPRDAKDKAGLVPILISAASADFEGWCRRPFIQASYTEDVKGGRERLRLKHRPVSTLTSVTDRVALPLAVKPTTEYREDADAGFIFLTDTATGVDTEARWGGGRGRWRVVYTAGYTLATMPDDVRVAVADLVVVRFGRRDGGENEESRGDWKSVRTLGIPKRVQDTIDRYTEEEF